MELIGQIDTASNAAYVGTIDGTAVIYKPIAGERPLWDFPDGTLAEREVAAYLVSQSFGWNIVPRTWLGEGPAGLGMLQLWQEVDTEQQPVDLVAADEVPSEGWRHVFDGTDEHDHPVALIHEDSGQLRRMTVYDIVVNNADRKGGHILPLPDGHRHGIDHGLTFHSEHKLRTVLWGFVGDELTTDELEGVERVRTDLDGRLGATLADLITTDEIVALTKRCERLLSRARFPAPRGQMPAVPWPIF
ncbi:SCO1664 family protein [Subtercola lobariae]|uniref:SCO1664 family protein n=1 Tax=Subtercola lobariae TaxID=1588641 RepID=UPI00166DDF0E|nr:SCO1664 family protein [Subtercola lobariae]